jgi:hypothetical protein
MFLVIWSVLDTISMDFSTKNLLKPLELTFLTSIYRQVFKSIKKLTLSCFVSSSIPTFSSGCIKMFLVIWSVLDTISMDFFKQKFIETTRTDIFDMLLSSRFKLIKKLTLSCFVSSSIPTLRWDVSRCFLLSEAFSIQFQWIFLSKNSLKPLELTFLSCCYCHVFKSIKKLTLSCFVSLSIPTFSLGCIEMFLVIWSVLGTISMIFLIKNSLKPLELTFLICYYRQVFKSIKKLTLSCFVSLSIPTFSLGCFEMFLFIRSVLDTISMIFLSKNSLKPLELTFLICYYRQVFKSIKKLTLSCFVSLSIPTFLLGCFEMFLVIWSVLDTISMDFFKQKFIETTRTDIFDMLLSSRF